LSSPLQNWFICSRVERAIPAGGKSATGVLLRCEKLPPQPHKKLSFHRIIAAQLLR
jgi:hypothetical protein